uniref:Putative secreted protein n=1 Tax=Anopheles darlingi TaxID=43151 RepID=A0A2M4DFD7_ANODA
MMANVAANLALVAVSVISVRRTSGAIRMLSANLAIVTCTVQPRSSAIGLRASVYVIWASEATSAISALEDI